MTNLKETLSMFMKKDDVSFLEEGVISVLNWNAVAGKYPFAPGFSSEHHDTYCNAQEALVREETMELITALANTDAVEVVDAVCDMFVVNSMLLFMYSAYDIDNSPLEIDECVSIIGADIAAIRDELPITGSPVEMLRLTENLSGDKVALTLMQEILHLMITLDFDMRGALKEVLASNMSKIPTVEEFLLATDAAGWGGDTLEDDINTQAKLIESKGRYSGVTGEVVRSPDGKDVIVFMDHNGKIMKPITFFSPDLSKYVK